MERGDIEVNKRSLGTPACLHSALFRVPGPLLIASRHTQFISGIAIAIGGPIAKFTSFQALLLAIGLMRLAVTIVQVRLSCMEDHPAAA